jgi:hypothetical protein
MHFSSGATNDFSCNVGEERHQVIGSKSQRLEVRSPHAS